MQTHDLWFHSRLDDGKQQHRVSVAAQPELICCSACSKQAFGKQARVGTPVQVQVLRGVVIIFSRIIPQAEVPSQHPLWLRAEAFGARCTAQTDDAVTHLVTNTQHTLKVHIACRVRMPVRRDAKNHAFAAAHRCAIVKPDEG